MRATKAITRTRYPTSTVNDLFVKLNGSKIFTKLDMTPAFHQIELDQDSRFITAFQSDICIKRSKRLIFGLNSAAEELQHALQTIFRLADIPGTTNIANDILIFTENTKQDDEPLTRVSERCESKNVTLNLEKSSFYKNNLKCYGFMFSKEGIKTGPEKIQEIQEAPAPERKKGLTKFSRTDQLHEKIYTRLYIEK